MKKIMFVLTLAAIVVPSYSYCATNAIDSLPGNREEVQVSVPAAVPAADQGAVSLTTVYGPDENSNTIKAWLDNSAENRAALKKYLDAAEEGVDIPFMINGKELAGLRIKVINALKIVKP